MNDEQLAGAWTALQPPALQRQRIDARVFEWLDARETRLAAEWLGLAKAAPFSSAALLAASAISMVTAPPLIWVARALI
jgi:hypothetical protein